MKGDFSRIRFTPAKLYTAVLKQQGRVDLDSDANEQCAIDVTLRETTNADVIGQYGGPVNGAGFEIGIDGDEISISAGRYYVDGILVEIANQVHYDKQPYLIDPTHTAKDLLDSLKQAGEGSCLVFTLEVWQRMATALDDPCLLEPALNQADTTTRLQTIWRVVGTVASSSGGSSGRNVLNPIQGQMGATTSGEGSGCGCQPIPAAGYQGMENQLYRVEIHQAGDLTSATFKWSRENGSVVVAVTDVNGSTVTVSSLGPDANLGFQVGQWVELSDNVNQFGPTPNQPGTLYQIYSINQAALQVTMTNPVTGLHKNRKPRMRRWDQSGSSATASGIPVSSASVALENGIVVDFSKGFFDSGDYWTIPARTANGSIDWPPCGGDGKHFQSPSSIQVNEAPLACVTWTSVASGNPGPGIHDDLLELKYIVTDQRSFFSPLAANAMHIEWISWNNADLITLDQFLYDGLYIALDQAPTSPLDAAVFRVSLEIAGFGFYRQQVDDVAANRIAVNKTTANVNLALSNASGITANTSGLEINPASIDTSLNTNTTGLEINPASNNSGLNINPAGTGTSTTPKKRICIGPALRQEYVLDGNVTKLDGRYGVGLVVNWNFPPSTDQGEIAYALNTLLLDAYQGSALTNANTIAAPAARVRVRLFGHMIYAESLNSCSPAQTIYLDGQCFGQTGQLSDGSNGITLGEPSGNGAVASDFESWFYLAPAPEVESVEFNPSSVTVDPSTAGAPAGSSSTATSTGTVQLAAPASSDLTVNLTANTQTGVTLTLSPTSIVIPAGQTTGTFTATAQSAVGTGGTQATFTVTATPQLETAELSQIFSGQGYLYVTVNNPVIITTTSLPAATIDRAYSTTLAATGGTTPYTWSIASGSLPAGLQLSSTGVISGTVPPSIAAASFSFTVKVSDSSSPQSTATQPLSIQVYDALAITTASPLPTGNQNESYGSTQLAATGGKTPYTWKITSGALPGGISLSSAGVISGTPTTSGQFTIGVEVTDSFSPTPNTASKSFTLPVNVVLK